MLFKNILFLFLGLSASAANSVEILAQTKLFSRKDKKDFYVQYSRAQGFYIVHFGLVWTNFNPEIHSRGFRLTESSGVRFIRPELPSGCALANTSEIKFPIFGFLNGLDGGPNLLNFALKGKSCSEFIGSLGRLPFSALFENVSASDRADSSKINLILEVLDTP